MKLVLLLLAAAVTAGQPDIHFTDVTSAAGLKFIHHNGAAGKKYLPETMDRAFHSPIWMAMAGPISCC